MAADDSSRSLADRSVPYRPALLWGVLAGIVYWVCAVRYASGSSSMMAYFDRLAEAFLDGRTYLDRPAVRHDLTLWAGKWYVPFLPLPAVLMLPFIAVLGVSGFNTVVFAVVVGGCNVALGHVLLVAMNRRGLTSLSRSATHWLTGMWAFSTVLWYMSLQGTVWFMGQTTATMFALLALIAAVRRNLVWSGVWLGIAMFGRPTLLLMVPAVLLLATDERQWRRMARPAARLLAPLAVSLALIAAYNHARFDSFTEFGYATQNVDDSLRWDLRDYGQFDTHFVGHNLWAAFAAGPTWDPEANTPRPDPFGMSIFLTTPAVALAGRARRRPGTRPLWLSVGLVSLPLAFYYNTGWYQFGFRFALDVWPMLLALVAIGAGSRVSRGWQALIVLGVLVNYWGMTWFGG